MEFPALGYNTEIEERDLLSDYEILQFSFFP